MKTVKSKGGDVRRVDDSSAVMLVNSGTWEYCSKEEYKKLYQKKKKNNTPTIDTDEVDIESRGLSDKKLRKERKRAKAEKNKNRN